MTHEHMESTEVASALPGQVETVRRFNRFYTRQLGLLEEGFLKSPLSLTEVRVLYEMAHHEETTATDLARELGLDPGYLSRILRGFRRDGLARSRRSKTDRRRQLLSLSEKGEQAFAALNATQRREIERLLEGLPVSERHRLLAAMQVVEDVLSAPPEHRVPYILRPHQSGDLGWIIHRHGILYNEEYGWNEEFEALVAEVVAHFVQHFDPARERCWIAEREGENVGSVLLVRHPVRPGVARLRLLLVEPRARGLGIGRRLVQECTRFARQVGYSRITLWTNSVLHSARGIYEAEGYELVEEAAHHSYGHDLTGQHWELRL